VSPGDVRALIVEDAVSWQKILSEILIDAGLAVDIADNVDAAITCLRTCPHRVAIVDLSLGGDDYSNKDGLLVLDAVRRLDPGCVTILLTGFATVELAVSALTKYGAFTCLRKEAFQRSMFRTLIGQALASPPPVGSAPKRESGHGKSQPISRKQESALEKPTLGTALVVEDDAGWRSILSELLADAGYQVTLCGSFGEGLGCLRRATYQLAVVDLALASVAALDPSLARSDPSKENLDGYRLLASTQAAGTPTIVVSGVATPPDIERAYAEHGIFAFVEKQAFDRRVFLSTVEEAYAEGRLLDDLEDLTRREREVLELLAHGMTNREIAEELTITTNTVKRHLKSIFDKLDVHTRSAAAAKAVSGGFSVDWPNGNAAAN
jgi:DNA-binding NarL/FixJ family response regulator